MSELTGKPRPSGRGAFTDEDREELAYERSDFEKSIARAALRAMRDLIERKL